MGATCPKRIYVRDAPSIDNTLFDHLVASSTREVLVNPSWLDPVLLRYQPKGHSAVRKLRHLPRFHMSIDMSAKAASHDAAYRLKSSVNGSSLRNIHG
jgi:hypothetical protein